MNNTKPLDKLSHLTPPLACRFMTYRILFALVLLAPAELFAQTPVNPPGYVPGVTYQTENPNYFKPNPFYFEGRIDWNLLGLDQPVNAWDYMQHGIYNQDDLQNTAAAIADYQTSLSMNSLTNGTCQIVTSTVMIPADGQLNPAPCMFTVRLRLAGLLKDQNPQQAISLYTEVLQIDPLRLSVHEHIAGIYEAMSEKASSATDMQSLLQKAIVEYQAELALSPVTQLEIQLTGDTANNAHVHWALAAIFAKLNQLSDQLRELRLYICATQWHSDVYPWRTALASGRVASLENQGVQAANCPAIPK
jgi:tetratricopeptide (TPR) repeat protein